MADEEDDEGEEIIVTGKRLRVDEPDESAGGFALPDWFFGRQYGPGTSEPNPFLIGYDQTLPPSEIVARACESLALAIETLTDLARPVLPRAEAARLDALAAAMKGAAEGLKAGQIDLSTARTLIQSSLAVALDTLGAAGMGVLFGALGSWASTFAPTPLTRALAIAGFGVFGLAADWYISSTNAANAIATQLTNALFNGAQALSDAINNVVQTIYDAMDFLPGHPPMPEESSLELKGSVIDNSNGDVVTVNLFHDGAAKQLIADANNIVIIPSDWNAPGDDPKSPWNDEPPIT